MVSKEIEFSRLSETTFGATGTPSITLKYFLKPGSIEYLYWIIIGLYVRRYVGQAFLKNREFMKIRDFSQLLFLSIKKKNRK